MSEFNLELREVSKSYKMLKTHEVPVLRNINMFVKSGEMVSLVGPSGAGKSTLLHIAGLLDSLDSGEVIICGRSMTQSSEKLRTITRRDEVGFVYQFHHLITEFTALENVMLPQLTAGKIVLKLVFLLKSCLMRLACLIGFFINLLNFLVGKNKELRYVELWQINQSFY